LLGPGADGGVWSGVRLRAHPPRGHRSEDGRPVISTQEAITQLRRWVDESRGSTVVVGAGTALEVTGVSLRHARFPTDRGWQRLPAWRFAAAGVSQPIAVLAARPFRAPRGRSRPLPGAPPIMDATDQGRALTLYATRAAPGTAACQATYTPVTAQTKHAVAVTIIEDPVPPPPHVFCPSIAYRVPISISLRAPLAGGVLIDAGDDAPIAIARPPFPLSAN